MNRQFLKSVEKACDDALVERSFERPRSGTRFIRLNENFLGWVGLNQGNHSDYLRINPFIGIHCIPIMKQKRELANEKYQEGYLATYAIHMGEIAPEVPQFILTKSADIKQEAIRLADDIIAYALPWMQTHSSYEALTPLLKGNIEMLGGFPEKYTSALYFSKRKAEAKRFVLSRTDLFDPNYDGSYSLYEKFGKPFLNMLDNEKGSS